MKIKPAVFMIRIKTNPVSMWEAGRTYECWTRAGFDVTIIDACTPEDLKTSTNDSLTYVDGYPEKLNFDTKKTNKKNLPFTETEKAVFFSHFKALSIAKRKKSKSIIIEHDACLVSDNLPEKMLNENIVFLGHTKRDEKILALPCLAYMIDAASAGYFMEDLSLRRITMNIDGYMHEFARSHNPNNFKTYMENVRAQEEFREQLGTTIDHGNDKHLPGTRNHLPRSEQ
jgi:hypothetical protein